MEMENVSKIQLFGKENTSDGQPMGFQCSEIYSVQPLLLTENS